MAGRASAGEDLCSRPMTCQAADIEVGLFGYSSSPLWVDNTNTYPLGLPDIAGLRSNIDPVADGLPPRGGCPTEASRPRPARSLDSSRHRKCSKELGSFTEQQFASQPPYRANIDT